MDKNSSRLIGVMEASAQNRTSCPNNAYRVWLYAETAKEMLGCSSSGIPEKNIILQNF